jgi:pimeloyl-ACP methyl ester carboxylesterase
MFKGNSGKLVATINGAAILQSMSPPDRQTTQDGKARIVLITHGIFSQGTWFDALARPLEEVGLEVKGLRYSTVHLLQFFIPEFIGRWMLPWFSRESALQRLLEQILAYPRDEYEVSIIAHSFGTWLVANILNRYPAVKIKRASFIGCIVKDDFPWGNVLGRNIERKHLINEVGNLDVWPLLANVTTWGYGPTGTFGFGKAHVVDRRHDSTHSQLLTEEFSRQYLAPFFLDGTTITPGHRPKQSCWTKCVGKTSGFWKLVLDWCRHLKWIVLVGLMVWIPWKYSYLVSSLIPHSSTDAPATISPQWKTWDKIVQPTKSSDPPQAKFKARLDKWESYMAQGAQPWLLAPQENDGSGIPIPIAPKKNDVVLGWFETELGQYPLDSFSYVFENTSHVVEIKEIYAWLVSNSDKDGYSPIYRQLKPTVEGTTQEIEIKGYQSGERFLCFIIVAPPTDMSAPADPRLWGIQLRRK